jgi:hypothetical protein
MALLACRDNPDIDGSKVPASAAACSGVCGRLEKLCGYAPPDCDDPTADGGGYCQANFDDTMLGCMSDAGSCQAAWECQPSPPVDVDAGGDEQPVDDGATGDAASD